ncbi:hypothetical protein ACPA9J_04985 [Pseudomonas aeruginosa]
MPELLAHYPFTDTAYHELLDRQGGVRPPLAAAVPPTGAQQP